MALAAGRKGIKKTCINKWGLIDFPTVNLEYEDVLKNPTGDMYAVINTEKADIILNLLKARTPFRVDCLFFDDYIFKSYITTLFELTEEETGISYTAYSSSGMIRYIPSTHMLIIY